MGLNWTVEPSGDWELDAKRVGSIVATLSSAGFPISADEVQVANPAALGLTGVQAERIGVGASRAVSRGSNLGGRGGGGRGSGRRIGRGF